ncbi:hypothetical protein B0H16DRAFT_1454607 [Mycena metata]|uniref:Protein kinase domain-containing protein n=1 Tax=Mycena metata TaxID=1033252 RepID=A0AAD7JIU6_9AGAR|nr:hypothetical protein B0H16DRAFT_1454607 [Mycena metata]
MDIWKKDGLAFTVTSFYPGLLLYAGVVREIASGLNHLHSLNIIHKDIKLENILIDYGGHCIIADYGACDIAEPANPTYDAARRCMRMMSGAGDLNIGIYCPRNVVYSARRIRDIRHASGFLVTWGDNDLISMTAVSTRSKRQDPKVCYSLDDISTYANGDPEDGTAPFKCQSGTVAWNKDFAMSVILGHTVGFLTETPEVGHFTLQQLGGRPVVAWVERAKAGTAFGKIRWAADDGHFNVRDVHTACGHPDAQESVNPWHPGVLVY